jgi:hypothetical protein
VAEDAVDACGRGLHQLLEVSFCADVEVAEQDQARGQPLAGLAGVRGHQHQPREVHAVERAEVDHRSVRDAVAHRGEETLDVVRRTFADRRDDRQGTLVRHRRRCRSRVSDRT